ncbi:MAG: glycosyl hydrolase family 18 protein [Terriglobia bacterium]
MWKTMRVIALIALGALTARAQAKSLFYMTSSPQSVQSFMEHANKIDILVPTWYSVDKDGMMWGGPDPLVLKTAKQHHVEVMPIVGGSHFNTDTFHQFVTNGPAKQEFIAALLRECKRNGYLGIQFDFENISWKDRDAFSGLVAEAAGALHREGYELSVATVPNAPGHPGQTAFSYWIFRDWRAAYDLQSLAKSADLICLMTYDQHTSYTPPGPVAGYPWVMENLDYALKVVPKNKLSLGIPLYGYHWYSGFPQGEQFRHNVEADYISAPAAVHLAEAYQGHIEWDPVDLTAWFYFYRDDTREWVFYTDTRTFAARLDLVKERGLQGFCSWVLGAEDPGIWNLLPSHH